MGVMCTDAWQLHTLAGMSVPCKHACHMHRCHMYRLAGTSMVCTQGKAGTDDCHMHRCHVYRLSGTSMVCTHR